MEYKVNIYMEKKTLIEEERLLLKHCLKEHAPDLLKKLDLLDSRTLDSTVINDLRSAVMDEFVERGLQPNDEPNAYGLRLEDLNEKIADLYLWFAEKKHKK
jgi:hypothetical protein